MSIDFAAIGILILKSLYFFLPVYVANMVPIVFKKVKILEIPVHEKWFGKNKTWRGMVLGILFGGITFWIQKLLYMTGFQSLSIIDYSDFSLWLGFLLGLGAMMGDIVESFYKRRAGIPPGEKWVPLDQTDFVIGGLLFSFFVFVPPIEVAVTLLIVSPILHMIVNHIGFWLGIRKSKW